MVIFQTAGGQKLRFDHLWCCSFAPHWEMQHLGRGLQHVSMGTGSQEIVSHNHNSSGEKGLKVSGKELEIAPAGSCDATVKLSTAFWTSFGLKSAAASFSKLLQCVEMIKPSYFTSPTDLGWND